MSRLEQAKPAVRSALKGRMMLSGPPGSGKTRSGLIIATDLAQGGSILGIDTEKESMLTYADDFDFTHLRWLAPFNPRELAETLNEAAESYAVIVIDSASHFWRAEGGALDIANGKYTGWKDARPAHEEMVEAILSVPAHVVVCVRSKIGHVQEQESNGQYKVRKVGMEAQQDDNFEYEMNIAVDMAIDHTATISKTRNTVLPVGRAFRAGHVVELAEIYREWLAAGDAPAATEKVLEIVSVLNGIDADNAHSEARKVAKAAFLATCGRPETIQESEQAEALSVAKRLATEAVEGGPAPDAQVSASSEVEKPEDLDTDPTETGASATTPSSTSAEDAQPGAGAIEEADLGQLTQDVEMAIKGLPTVCQRPARDELRKSFGDLTAASEGELVEALRIVKTWPIPDPTEGKARAAVPGSAEAPLKPKQRQTLAYAHGKGIDNAQLAALGAFIHETTEPRPLHELNDRGCLEVMALIDRVRAGEIVFEQPNGVLIAKEKTSV